MPRAQARPRSGPQAAGAPVTVRDDVGTAAINRKLELDYHSRTSNSTSDDHQRCHRVPPAGKPPFGCQRSRCRQPRREYLPQAPDRRSRVPRPRVPPPPLTRRRRPFPACRRCRGRCRRLPDAVALLQPRRLGEHAHHVDPRAYPDARSPPLRCPVRRRLKVKVEPYAVSIVPCQRADGRRWSPPTSRCRLRSSRIRATPTTGGGIGVAPAARSVRRRFLRRAAAAARRTTQRAWSGVTLISAAGCQDLPRIQRRDLPTRRQRNLPARRRASWWCATRRRTSISSKQLVAQENQTIIKQVEIESKFIEITQDNLKELSFDWTLGTGKCARQQRKCFSAAAPLTRAPDRASAASGRANFPVHQCFGDRQRVVGSSPVTAGNRSGTFAHPAPTRLMRLLFGGGCARWLPPASSAWREFSAIRSSSWW